MEHLHMGHTNHHVGHADHMDHDTEHAMHEEHHRNLTHLMGAYNVSCTLFTYTRRNAHLAGDFRNGAPGEPLREEGCSSVAGSWPHPTAIQQYLGHSHRDFTSLQSLNPFSS